MVLKTPEILDGAVDFETFYYLLRKEKNHFVLRILYFIFDLYYGLSVPEASKKHKITKETGYKYAKIWRTESIEGLRPDYNNGRTPKMTEEQENIVKNEIRQGKIHRVDDLINFILKSFKISYSKSWAYELFRELSLKDGIKYPLPEKKEIFTDEKDLKEKNEPKIFLNDEGLECLKVSKKLYFIRHKDTDILNELIISEKNNKLLKRYLFVNSLNNGLDIEKTMNILNISISTARLWLKQWNNSGLDGLIIKWSGGRPNFLSKEQENEVKDFIKNNHVTKYSEIHEFILDNYNVDYSLSHIYRFVKKTRI